MPARGWASAVLPDRSQPVPWLADWLASRRSLADKSSRGCPAPAHKHGLARATLDRILPGRRMPRRASHSRRRRGHSSDLAQQALLWEVYACERGAWGADWGEAATALLRLNTGPPL